MFIPLNERKLRDVYLKSLIASTVKAYIGSEANETIIKQVLGLYNISFEDIEYLKASSKLSPDSKSFLNGIYTIVTEGVNSYVDKYGYSIQVPGSEETELTDKLSELGYSLAVEKIDETMNGSSDELTGIEPTDETDPVGGSVGSVIKAMLDDLKNRTAQDVAQTTQSILNLQKEQQEKEKEEMNIEDDGDVLDDGLGEEFDDDVENLELDKENEKEKNNKETDKDLEKDVEEMEKELKKTDKKDSKNEEDKDNLEGNSKEEGKDDNPFKALESIESVNDTLKANLQQALKDEVENFKSVKGIIGVLFDMFGSEHGFRLMKHIRYTHNNQIDYKDLHNPKSDKIFIDKSKKSEFIQLLTKTSKEVINALEKDNWFKTLKKYNLVKYSNKFNEKDDEFEIAIIDYNNLRKCSLDQLKKFYSNIMNDLGLEPGDNLDTITDKEYMLDIIYTELSYVIDAIESTISGEIRGKSYIGFMSYWKNNQCILTLTLEDIAFESACNSFLSEEELYEMTAGFVNGFENAEMRFDDVLTEMENEYSYTLATEAIEDGYIKHGAKSYASGVVVGMLLKYLHLTFSPKEFKVNTIDLNKSQYMEEKENIINKINANKAELEVKLEKLPLIKFLMECGVLKLFPESKVDEYSSYVVLGVKENANISFDKKSMTIHCNGKELSMKELGLLDRILTKDSTDEGNIIKNQFMRSFGETLGKNFEKAGNEIRKFLKEKGLNKSEVYAGVGAYRKFSGWSGVAIFFHKLSIASRNASEEGTEGIKEIAYDIKSIFTPSAWRRAWARFRKGEFRYNNKKGSIKVSKSVIDNLQSQLEQAIKTEFDEFINKISKNKLLKFMIDHDIVIINDKIEVTEENLSKGLISSLIAIIPNNIVINADHSITIFKKDGKETFEVKEFSNALLLKSWSSMWEIADKAIKDMILAFNYTIAKELHKYKELNKLGISFEFLNDTRYEERFMVYTGNMIINNVTVYNTPATRINKNEIMYFGLTCRKLQVVENGGVESLENLTIKDLIKADTEWKMSEEGLVSWWKGNMEKAKQKEENKKLEELRSENKNITSKEINNILKDQYHILSQAYKDMIKEFKSNSLVKSYLDELNVKLCSEKESMDISIRPTNTNPNRIGLTVIEHEQPYHIDADNFDEIADTFYDIAKKSIEKYNKDKYRIGFDDYGIGLDTKDIYILVDTPSSESYFEDNISLESNVFNIIRNNNTLTHIVLESVGSSLENQFYSEYVNPGIITRFANESIFTKDNSLHIPLMIIDKTLIDTSKEFMTYALKTGIQKSKDLIANIFNKVEYRYAIESIGDDLVAASVVIDNFDENKFNEVKIGFESYQDALIERNRCKIALENFDRMIDSLSDYGIESENVTINHDIVYKGIYAKLRLNKIPQVASESITQYIMKDDMISLESFNDSKNNTANAMENLRVKLSKEYQSMSYSQLRKIYNELGQRTLDLHHNGTESVSGIKYNSKEGIVFTMSSDVHPGIESVDRINAALYGLESLDKVITRIENGNLEIVIPVNLGVNSCEGYSDLAKALKSYKEFKDFNNTKDLREIGIESLTGEIIKPFWNLNSEKQLFNFAIEIVDKGFDKKLEESYKRYGVESEEYKSLATKYQNTVKMVYESLAYSGVLLARLGLESNINFINNITLK